MDLGPRDSVGGLLDQAGQSPFAQERLRLRGDGRVALELKRAWLDGTRELVFEPLEFLERLAAMTPRPDTNLLICHGVLAPRARWRARVVVYGRPVPAPTASTAPRILFRGSHRERRYKDSLQCVNDARLQPPLHWRPGMTQVMRLIVTVMLVVGVATMAYAQTGAMTPDQMKMMSGQMKMMSDQMKGGKMSADQTKMMAEHMQMMADRMKDGQMTPDQMKMMQDHMKMMNDHMKGGMKGKM